ncbi:MAG TPA: sulfatase [Blastocatellia bacterium]|nr:sulfatase [Blastocatellia bacterium]
MTSSHSPRTGPTGVGLLALVAVSLFVAMLAVIPAACHRTNAALKTQSDRPNILIIMTDDQSHDTLTAELMPRTKALIADAGVTFNRAYISTPLCCPSRSSFLTGKYARHHGVHTNDDKLDGPTIANQLHQAGYYTGLIGKYLNSWPGDARSEFDYWTAWKSGDVDPVLNVFGETQQVSGYLTYILRDHALDFLDRVPSDKPFFLVFAPHAPHRPATPAPEDENLYSDLPPWRPPNFNPESMTDKPSWLQSKARLTDEEVDSRVDKFRLKQLRSLKAVDRSVDAILGKLTAEGKLDNTFILFYSDNGYYWGEYRLVGKNRVYEEATRVPFAIRYSPLSQVPRIESHLVGVIDIAPTLCDLAGIPTPADMDGKSLLPLLAGGATWRDAMLLEGWPTRGEEDGLSRKARLQDLGADHSAHFRAIRTDKYVYIETEQDSRELYDTTADPYEMNNLIEDTSYLKVIRQLRKRLRREF